MACYLSLCNPTYHDTYHAFSFSFSSNGNQSPRGLHFLEMVSGHSFTDSQLEKVRVVCRRAIAEKWTFLGPEENCAKIVVRSCMLLVLYMEFYAPASLKSTDLGTAVLEYVQACLFMARGFFTRPAENDMPSYVKTVVFEPANFFHGSRLLAIMNFAVHYMGAESNTAAVFALTLASWNSDYQNHDALKDSFRLFGENPGQLVPGNVDALQTVQVPETAVPPRPLVNLPRGSSSAAFFAGFVKATGDAEQRNRVALETMLGITLSPYQYDEVKTLFTKVKTDWKADMSQKTVLRHCFLLFVYSKIGRTALADTLQLDGLSSSDLRAYLHLARGFFKMQLSTSAFIDSEDMGPLKVVKPIKQNCIKFFSMDYLNADEKCARDFSKICRADLFEDHDGLRQAYLVFMEPRLVAVLPQDVDKLPLRSGGCLAAAPHALAINRSNIFCTLLYCTNLPAWLTCFIATRRW